MRRLMCGVMALLICSGAGVATAQYPGWRVRSFDAFDYDAAVNDGLWLEGYGGYLADSELQGDIEVEQWIAGARIVHGWRFVELGFTIPWYQFEVNDEELSEGMGDMSFFAKAVPLQTEHFSLGGGLQILAPTGGDRFHGKELGLVPFGSMAVKLSSRFELRGFGAYQTATGFEDLPENFKSILFGGGLFVAANEYLGVRAEFLGTHTYGHHLEVTSAVFEPGIDIRFLFPEIDMLFRPTAVIGLEQDSFDWGVLWSVVVARTPDWITR